MEIFWLLTSEFFGVYTFVHGKLLTKINFRFVRSRGIAGFNDVLILMQFQFWVAFFYTLSVIWRNPFNLVKRSVKLRVRITRWLIEGLTRRLVFFFFLLLEGNLISAWFQHFFIFLDQMLHQFSEICCGEIFLECFNLHYLFMNVLIFLIFRLNSKLFVLDFDNLPILSFQFLF